MINNWKLERLSEFRSYAIYRMIDYDITAILKNTGVCELSSYWRDGIECNLDLLVERLMELQQISKGVLNE